MARQGGGVRWRGKELPSTHLPANTHRQVALLGANAGRNATASLRYDRAEAAARYPGLTVVEGNHQCLDGIGGRRLLRLRPSLLLLHAIVVAAGPALILG